MQFSTAFIATVLAAAASALPNMTPRETTFTELAVFNGSGCQSGARTGTINLLDGGDCHDLAWSSPILSALVWIDIPETCSIRFFTGTGCSSVNFIDVPAHVPEHSCFEFGSGRTVGSYKATGVCSPF
ncbi:hypothetical protein P154DRAFT_564120 [Amniculicola lignicola CBS 123094]|uniref:Uncharacterized protein n=1 Tax=Amniculicola lignicola CBS 123094 TaxID=1392246 RepID=A0A6A5WCG0_9PLEO|nr:hypothetical protein P154DRAFT_564120 [Amniculicola lignicola CBS 123094]